MRVSIITVLPGLFDAFWQYGIVKKAIDIKKLSYFVYSIRDFVTNRHACIDDKPFGGGCGMLIKPKPITLVLKSIMRRNKHLTSTVFLSPQGEKLTQVLVSKLLQFDEIIFICGRYEGVDERTICNYADFEISIGDYILTGGELASMVLIDAVARLIPGVLGNYKSVFSDTFSCGLIEHAQYTRPRLFEGELIPEVLISGNHRNIRQWKLKSSIIRTLLKRRDLLEGRKLTLDEIDILNKWRIKIERIIQKQSIYGFDSSSSS